MGIKIPIQPTGPLQVAVPSVLSRLLSFLLSSPSSCPSSVAGHGQAVLATSDGTGNSSLVSEPFWLQGPDLYSPEGVSETFRHFRALRFTQVCVYPAEYFKEGLTEKQICSDTGGMYQC